MYGERYGGPEPYRGGGGGYGGGGYGGGGYGGEYNPFAMCCGPNLIPAVAMFLLLVVFCLFIPGFAANNWIKWEVDSATTPVVTTKYYYGLWRTCGKVGSASSECADFSDDAVGDVEDWHTATQALMCVSLICLLIGTALILYWLCSEARYFCIKCIYMLLLILAFICSLVGVIVFGANATDVPTGSTLDIDFDWCYYLVDVATTLMLFVPILLVCVPSIETFPAYAGMMGPTDRFGFGYPQRPPPPPGPRPAYGPQPIATIYPSSRPKPYGSGSGYPSGYASGYPSRY